MYSRFISYLGSYSTEEDQIDYGAKLYVAYPIMSIPHLLMPCWLKEPGHQQAWYWPNKPEYSVSSIRRVNNCKFVCYECLWIKMETIFTGLDTNFFLNLSVGQPSNNIWTCPKSKSTWARWWYSSFFEKNRGELYICCIFNFYFKITVFEAHCHIINHWCSSLEVFSVHFDVTGTRNTFQGI